MFGIKKNKGGAPKQKSRLTLVFRQKGFWAQFGWLAFLFAGCALAVAYRSIVLFTAVLVSAFLGMNEFGRWRYRSNLVFCSAVAICGSVAGVFNWLETAAIFLMMCITGGFVLYYRDRVKAVLPAMYEFSDVLAYCTGEAEVAWKADAMLRKMLPDCKIFVMLTDGVGRLFLPENGEEPERRLNRQGGVVWQCFADDVPYKRNSVIVEQDQPLHRETRSLVSVPIKACGETLGVIQVESRIPAYFSGEDVDRLCVVAFLTGQAIKAVSQK